MTEQQRYEVVERRPGFEIRRYPEHLVSETVVAASFEQAATRPSADWRASSEATTPPDGASP